MDPVKKTFRDAFAEFEQPVGEELWAAVQAKRQRPGQGPQIVHMRRHPLVRIAVAAVFLLGLSAGLWVALQPAGPAINHPDVMEPPMALEIPSGKSLLPAPEVREADATVSNIQTSPTRKIRTANSRNGAAAAFRPVTEQPARFGEEAPLPRITVRESMIASRQPSLQTMITPAFRATTAEETISLTDDAIAEGRPVPWADARPQNPLTGIAGRPMDTEGLLKKTLFRKKDKTPPPSLPPAEEVTAPQRVLAAIEKVRPRLVDDLLALGSRETEIEINW